MFVTKALTICGTLLAFVPVVSLDGNGVNDPAVSGGGPAGPVGYWESSFSPNTVASVPFSSGHIAVWAHDFDKGRYYAQPLALLNHTSARIRNNPLVDKIEVAFDLIMWSVEAQEAVTLYVQQYVDASATRERIGLVKMEQVRIVWKRGHLGPSFNLVSDWRQNTHLPSVLTFVFECTTREKCDLLQALMHAEPDLFDPMELQYRIHGHLPSRKQIEIRSEHITGGKLFAALENMKFAEEFGPERYLNSDDFNRLVSESISRVVASSVQDSSFVAGDETERLKDLVAAMLSKEMVSTKEDSVKWESVFWDPAYARPDKTVNTVNDQYRRDRTETEANGGYAGIEVGGKVMKERELHNIATWNGEKYVVKPMKLHRVNLAELSTGGVLLSTSVQLERVHEEYGVAVRTGHNLGPQTTGLTPELVQLRLEKKIQAEVKVIRDDLAEKGQTLENDIRSVETNYVAFKSETDVKFNTRDAYWPVGVGWYCINIIPGHTCPPGFNYGVQKIKKRPIPRCCKT